MNRHSLLLNLSLLKTHPAYRAVFLARFISILGLGLLGVAVPVQIQTLTGSPFQVGLAVTLTGAAMFIGLMTGGVLADRYERKTLILLARSTCGLGFIGLWINAMLPAPSVIAIYALGLWDGFFGAIGVTALLAATPAIVGRENLMQAGAITMLTVRLGSVISPLLGGVLLAWGGVAWNYALAALGTFLTLLPLLTLPALPAPQMQRQHPLRALADGLRFLAASPGSRRRGADRRAADDGERGARALSRACKPLADDERRNRRIVRRGAAWRGARGAHQRRAGTCATPRPHAAGFFGAGAGGG